MTALSGFRRRIRLQARPGTVWAELEDDFHHFRVVLGHDGALVTSVTGEAVRYPWQTCPFAYDELAPLVGMALSPSSTAVGRRLSARLNCTHQFDLAGLAVAHATRRRTERQYDVFVPDRDAAGRTRPVVRCDGVVVVEWDLRGREIAGPPPFSEVPLRGGSFLRWAEEVLDLDTAEAAIVLRRACEISWGRVQDLDTYDSAAPLAELMRGVCYTFQPSRAAGAARMKGTIRDFSDDADRLLARPWPGP